VFRKLKKEAEKGLRIFVERVRREYPGTSIVLFGSRARGDYLPYSDYDVALVLPDSDCSDKIGVAEEARRLRPRGLSLDLVVLCASELDDPLVKQMLRDKKVLYDGLGLG